MGQLLIFLLVVGGCMKEETRGRERRKKAVGLGGGGIGPPTQGFTPRDEPSPPKKFPTPLTFRSMGEHTLLGDHPKVAGAPARVVTREKFLDLSKVEVGGLRLVVHHHHAAALTSGGEFGALGSFLNVRVLAGLAFVGVGPGVLDGVGLK